MLLRTCSIEDLVSFVLFFFFQAEDGIRDVAVTGVQTCALPIYVRGDDRREGERKGDRQERPRSEELGDDRLPGRDRHGQQQRSEERRVGKECRAGWSR